MDAEAEESFHDRKTRVQLIGILFWRRGISSMLP